MKKHRRILLESALVLFAAILFSIYYYWLTAKPEDPRIVTALSIAAAIDIILLFLVMRAIWRSDSKSAFGRKLKELLSRMADFVMRIANKWNLFGRNDNVISGVTSVSFDYSLFKRRKEKPKKFIPPRWKDMKNGREKLGFIYYKMISRRIRKGMEICAHETPTEIKARKVNSDEENLLFDIYIQARYDERFEVDEQEVLELKERLFD